MSRLALPCHLAAVLLCVAAFAGAGAGSGAVAEAEVSRADLAKVGVHTAAGARAPLDLRLLDQTGRATTLGAALDGETGVLVFQDYRCKTLCGPALAIVAAGVKASGLKPGHDFRLVALGLNPSETPADAHAMQTSRLAGQPDLLAGSTFLSGDAAAIVTATQAMGFGYAYDPATDQFTHPVAAFILSPGGRVARVLPEVSLTGPDLRRAVLAADRGEVGGLVDTLRLLCHDLVPLTGRYDGAVQTGLRIGGVVTVLAMLGAGALLFRRRTV